MFKKMRIFVSAVLLLSLFQAQAKSLDIYGEENSTYFIKVTEYTSDGKNKDYVGFEICSIESNSMCEVIGNKKFYSKVKLAKLRNEEKADVLYAVLADMGIGLVGLYGGGILGAGVLSTALGSSGTMLGVSVGSLSGIGGAIVITKYVDAVNPFEQGRQVRILSSSILDDIDISFDRKVEDIAQTLRTVLSNLK